QLWEDLEHRYFGGIEVLRALNRRSGNPQSSSMPVVFTSALGLESQQDSPLLATAPELKAQDYGITQTSQVYLDHQVSESHNDLVLTWDAIEDLFPAGVLDEMFAAYRKLLEGLSSQQLKWEQCYRIDLPAPQRASRELINATSVERAPTTLHELFLKQLPQRPQAPAVICGDLT